MDTEVFVVKPGNFNPKFEIVSCFCLCENKFVLLHRQNNKAQGNTWGMPAGKVEKKEIRELAVLREVFEETGIKLQDSDLKFHRTFFVRYLEYDFIYHVYSSNLNKRPKIIINPTEHKAYLWVTAPRALEMNLIGGLDFCIRSYFNLDA